MIHDKRAMRSYHCASRGSETSGRPTNRYRYPCLPCLRAPPVCVRRTGRHTGRHMQAQAGVPTAQVENTKSKRTISIESPPCRPGAKDEATSCRKIFRQPIGNGSIAIPIAIPIARRRKHGASNPPPTTPPLGQYRSDHASPYRYIDRPTPRRQCARQVAGGPRRPDAELIPRDGKTQGRWSAASRRGTNTKSYQVAHAAPGGRVPPSDGKAQGR